MAVDVDDRKLGARYGVRGHDQRRSRLVVADVRQRDVRLTFLAGARTKLPGGRLRGRQAGGDNDERENEEAAHEWNDRRSQRAVSRILSPSTRPCGLAQGDDHSSRPAIAGGLQRPTRRRRRAVGSPAGEASLFGLAPCGVLPATRVATGAVRSYRTFSPLPDFALGPSGSGFVEASSDWTSLTDRPFGPAAPKLEARSAESEGGRYIFCATFLRVT